MRRISRLALSFAVLLFPSATLLAQSKFANDTYATLHARAVAGDAAAENELGVRFRMGDGVDKDLLTALGWYRLAAKQGLAIAYFNLGAAYYNGDGIPSDEQAACKWFLLASEAGDPSGKDAYAREQDDPKTDHGNICMVLAGDALMKGTEVPKDEKRAMQFYTAAAEAKNSMADVRLYFAYRDGLGAAKDSSSAMQHLEVAADRHDGYAMYLLGKVYEIGEGVPTDLHRACEEYKRSAKQGSHDGFHALGVLYRDGHGVKQDLPRAYLLLGNAAPNDPKTKAEIDELKTRLSSKEWNRLKDRDAAFRLADPSSASCH